MNIFYPYKYYNFFQQSDMGLSAVDNIMRTDELTYFHEKDDDLEYNMTLPSFVDCFYKLVVHDKIMPTQAEFRDSYFVTNPDFIKTLREDQLIPMKGRLHRTYPTLARDLHFLLSLRKFLDCSLIYSKKLDMENGIDIMVSDGLIYYGLELFLKSDRSDEFREKKKDRSNKFDNVTYVEIPLEKDKASKIGGHCVYGIEHLLQVEKLLN